MRELDEVIIWLSGKSLNLCANDRSCLHWVSINPSGEIYPCEYLREQYYYGHIDYIDLSDVFYTHGYQEFKRIYEVIPSKCQRCKFFQLCGNGCPTTRVKNGRISFDGIYAFCEERQRLYREIEKVFKKTLNGGEKNGRKERICSGCSLQYY